MDCTQTEDADVTATCCLFPTLNYKAENMKHKNDAVRSLERVSNTFTSNSEVSVYCKEESALCGVFTL